MKPEDCYHFGNDPTYHYFRWLMTCPEKVRAHVEIAFELVEDDSWFQIGVDPSTVARDELAHLLKEDIYQALPVNPDIMGIPNFSGDYGGPVGEMIEGLAVWAAAQIDFETLAEAVLRCLGKWNRDTGVPEILAKYPKPGPGAADGADPEPPPVP